MAFTTARVVWKAGNHAVHTKPDLRHFLQWKVVTSGSVTATVHCDLHVTLNVCDHRRHSPSAGRRRALGGAQRSRSVKMLRGKP